MSALPIFIISISSAEAAGLLDERTEVVHGVLNKNKRNTNVSITWMSTKQSKFLKF